MHKLSASALMGAVILGMAACSTAPDETTGVTSVALAPSASGDGQSGPVGQLLALRLQVLVKRNGVPAEGVDVHWATTSGNGTVGPAVSTTDADGMAITGWTLPTTAGAVSASASVADADGSPVAFTATALAGPATTTTAAGNNQTAPVGTLASEPLSIRLEDQYGNPVAGLSVTWSVVSGEATLSATQVDTDAGGAAVVSVTAGNVAGPVLIRAIPPSGLPSSDFNLTVTP